MPLEKRCGRRERVSRVVDEVWGPRSVRGGRVHEMGGWHERGLPDLACPGSPQSAGIRDNAPVNEGKRIDKLGAETLRAPTVPGQSCKGAIGGERADVAAEARLLAPDRHEDRRWHAKALLDLGERRGIALQLGLSPRDHSRGDVSCGEAGEVVPEHGGAAVVPLDCWVIGDAVERCVNSSARQAVLHRHFLEGGEPGAKALAIFAAIFRMSGRSCKNGRSCDECQSSQLLPRITRAQLRRRRMRIAFTSQEYA